MAQRVLDVGNCSFDHSAIKRLIEANFDASVVQTHGEADTLEALRSGDFGLVLINRQLNRDASDGIELIRRIKASENLAPIPVMLISNLDQFQQQAVEAGAEPGFGKDGLNSPETHGLLARVLNHTSKATQER
jgi:CheY-like chemotaxis protein